ncbi:putative reverse transcriptase domain-containing protein [Tanacetum coccineum]
MEKRGSYLSGQVHYKRKLKHSREEKRLRTYPPFKTFPEVFPEDLPVSSDSTMDFKFDFSEEPLFPLPRIDDLLIKLQGSSCPYRKIVLKIRISPLRSKQEHEKHLKMILELLKKEVLYAKFSKCEFWIPKCLAGYYRRFIEGFSKIAKPMTKLTQKKINAPILALPEEAKIFIAYCEASKNVLGAVLMQEKK